MILHVLAHAGLCERSISACVDKMCGSECKLLSVCARVCVCVSHLSSFGEKDEQRSKVTAHKAALKNH